jgi:membrane-bound lytic murein transglycosylase A
MANFKLSARERAALGGRRVPRALTGRRPIARACLALLAASCATVAPPRARDPPRPAVAPPAPSPARPSAAPPVEAPAPAVALRLAPRVGATTPWRRPSPRGAAPASASPARPATRPVGRERRLRDGRRLARRLRDDPRRPRHGPRRRAGATSSAASSPSRSRPTGTRPRGSSRATTSPSCAARGPADADGTRVPLYARPRDLVSGARGVGRLSCAGAGGATGRARRSRAGRSGRAGRPLVWVDDAVEAFFLEIQGSGPRRLR